MRALPLEGQTRVEGQIDALEVLPSSTASSSLPLLALASSRLEGSTWDGALTLLQAQAQPGQGQQGLVLTRAGPVRPFKYGIPALAWCGSGSGSECLLAAAQDNGDVEVLHVVDKGEGQRELTPYTTLAEHDDLVSALAAAPSAGSDGGGGGGQTLATGSWDCGIRLWNLASPMNALREFTAHVAPVTAMAWHPFASTQELLASASRDKSVKAWDVRAKAIGDCARLLDGMAHAALSLAWLPRKEHVLAMGLEDGGVALVDLRRPGMLLAEQRPHATRTGVVRVSASAGVVASSSALLLASGGDDGGVAVTPIDEQAGDEGSAFDLGDSILSCPRLHSDYVRALAWLHGADNDGDDDGRVLLTGGWDGELRALGMA